MMDPVVLPQARKRIMDWSENVKLLIESRCTPAGQGPADRETSYRFVKIRLEPEGGERALQRVGGC